MADRAGKRETGKRAVKSAVRSLRKPRPAVSRADLEEAFNAITNLVMLLSSDYTIKWANKATATFLNEAGSNMLGIDRQKVDRFNVMQVIPDHLK